MITIETTEIQINFDGSSINYVPSTARAERNTLVKWRSDDPFVVNFYNWTPFKRVEYHSHWDPQLNVYLAEALVRSDAQLGTYRYNVAGVRKLTFDFITNPEVLVDHSADLQVDDLG